MNWQWTHAVFIECGSTVERLLSDNGSRRRSHGWGDLPQRRRSAANAPATGAPADFAV
jgi:hypothetical protein